MHTGNHSQLGRAASIPVNETRPVVSFSPVVIPAPNRPIDLEARVTFPSTGDKLPILLLATGQGRSAWLNSLEGYPALYEFYAAHGFAVLQPSPLSSGFLGLTSQEGNEMFWQERVTDHSLILDHLDEVQKQVPGLAGRLDTSRIAIIGHSAGAMSVSYLLGASNTDPRTSVKFHKPDFRIKAGVLLGGAGEGGATRSEMGLKMVPFYDPDFGSMTTEALTVWGDEDFNPYLTSKSSDWHKDCFTFGPGKKTSLMLKGAKHGLGGISGWDALECDDASVERLGFVQRLTWAWLWSAVNEGNGAWESAKKAFEGLDGVGEVESKGY